MLTTDLSKRNFLKAATMLAASSLMAQHSRVFAEQAPGTSGHKVVLLISGGVRRQETFSAEGAVNIPNLSGKLLAQSVFFPDIQNDGVTSHFNTNVKHFDRQLAAGRRVGKHAPGHSDDLRIPAQRCRFFG